MTLTDFIGLPYLSKGRALSGVDCWGLVYLFYKYMLKLDVPSYTAFYRGSEDNKSVVEAITENLPNWEAVAVEDAAYGDMMLFRIMGLPMHTGVYLGDGNFLHSFRNTNTCIERLGSVTWNRRLIGIYRWQKT